MPVNNFTYENQFRGLPILPEPEFGNRIDILNRIRLLMDDMIDRHCKVLCTRLDMSLSAGTGPVPHNRHMQAFVDAFSAYLASKRIDHHHVWAREQESAASGIHWHALVMMDGNRTRSFFGPHLKRARKLWTKQAGGGIHLGEWWEADDSRFPYVKNGGVMIRRNGPDFDQAYRLAYERFSYLAKQITKTAIPPGLRAFSSSHLS